MGSYLFLGTLEALSSVLTTAAVASSVAFQSAALPGLRWRELVFGSCLPRPTNGRRLAGIGQLRESHEDRVAIGHAGCPEGGLYEQAPRAAVPILSVDFPRLG